MLSTPTTFLAQREIPPLLQRSMAKRSLYHCSRVAKIKGQIAGREVEVDKAMTKDFRKGLKTIEIRDHINDKGDSSWAQEIISKVSDAAQVATTQSAQIFQSPARCTPMVRAIAANDLYKDITTSFNQLKVKID